MNIKQWNWLTKLNKQKKLNTKINSGTYIMRIVCSPVMAKHTAEWCMNSHRIEWLKINVCTMYRASLVLYSYWTNRGSNFIGGRGNGVGSQFLISSCCKCQKIFGKWSNICRWGKATKNLQQPEIRLYLLCDSRKQ